MKKKIMIVLIILSSIVLMGNAVTDDKPQQFKVIYEIVYNSITLEHAAQLEKKIREQYKDACSVNVKVEQINISNKWMIYNGQLHLSTTLLDTVK